MANARGPFNNILLLLTTAYGIRGLTCTIWSPYLQGKMHLVKIHLQPARTDTSPRRSPAIRFLNCLVIYAACHLLLPHA